MEDRKDLDRKDIWRSVWWWYQNLAEFALEWELPHYSPAERDKAFPLLQARARGEVDLATFDREAMIIIGTPDECLEKIQRYADVGVDQVICYKQFGYIASEDVKRSMTLLGEHVIPKLDAASKAAAPA